MQPLLVVFLIFGINLLKSQTILPGYISDTTLTVSNSPYIVNNHIIFGGHITIENGVQIVFMADFFITLWGSLNCGCNDQSLLNNNIKGLSNTTTYIHFIGNASAPTSIGLFINHGSTITDTPPTIQLCNTLFENTINGIVTNSLAYQYAPYTVYNCEFKSVNNAIKHSTAVTNAIYNSYFHNVNSIYEVGDINTIGGVVFDNCLFHSFREFSQETAKSVNIAIRNSEIYGDHNQVCINIDSITGDSKYAIYNNIISNCVDGIEILSADISVRNVRKIPSEIENKLEESLSVVESFDIANNNIIIAPPPNEPIPNDILQQHRQRAATHMPNKNENKNDNRRNTYHSNVNKNKNKNELEMQIVSNKYDVNSFERVRTQSMVDAADDDPPTPVSDDHNIMFEDNKNHEHEKHNSLKHIANKRLSKSIGNNKRNDPALALLSEEPIEKKKINVNKNNNENENDPFAELNVSSAKMLFNEQENIDNKKDPFSSIEVEFNALSTDLKKEPSQKKSKPEQSDNDIILGIFDNENENDNNNNNNMEESILIAAAFNALSIEIQKEASQKKLKAEQSGNDVILGILGDENEQELEQSLSVAEVAVNNKPEILNSEPKKENDSEVKPSHRGKQVEDVPFASLDMGMGNDLFGTDVMEEPKVEKEIIEQDVIEQELNVDSAMDVLMIGVMEMRMILMIHLLN